MSKSESKGKGDGSRDGAREILFPRLPHRLAQRAPAALGDARLQGFLRNATLLKDAARRRRLQEDFGDRVTQVRRLAADIKQRTLDRLDHHLERFVDRAKERGTEVHFARDGAQANAIVSEIARGEGARLCVKSKSMVTEETGLVEALEAAGCETVETDLGEYILQLDGDAPSHIVTPMIHKDRGSVARIFERELGERYTEDAGELTRIARRHLRGKYRRADLGVSGGNFLVASQGSVVLCTNEGNGRFCTSLPRVHVAVVGIEKLVPDVAQLSVLLKLLARSSAGQPLTCYTQILAGPRRPGEADGPERMHVVLVDNGRTEVLSSETRELLRCIRCGACLNTCPVYRLVGGHAFGSVYPGPIGAVLTPLLRGVPNYPDLPHASSLCGACREACPVDIDLPRLLVTLRRRGVEERTPGLRERLAFRAGAWVLASPLLFRFALRALRALLRGRGGARDWVSRGPGPIGAWTRARDFPAPARRSFHEWWRERERDR